MNTIRWTVAAVVVALTFYIFTVQGNDPSVSKADFSDESLLWLEDVESEKALSWVNEENQKTLSVLAEDPLFEDFKQQALDILTASDRIPSGQIRGGYFYNFWRDETNVRGIWRRTPVKGYKVGKVEWELLLDVDKLAADEGKNWVYKWSTCLAPEYNRCLVSLSPGGTDATTYREFDINAKSFVEGGFQVPFSKTNLNWENEDTLLIATDWGNDEQGASTMNDSGYPMIMKRWKRGTDLASAEVVHKMPRHETFSHVLTYTRPEGKAVLIRQAHDFYNYTFYAVDKKGDLKEMKIRC